MPILKSLLTPPIHGAYMSLLTPIFGANKAFHAIKWRLLCLPDSEKPDTSITDRITHLGSVAQILKITFMALFWSNGHLEIHHKWYICCHLIQKEKVTLNATKTFICPMMRTSVVTIITRGRCPNIHDLNLWYHRSHQSEFQSPRPYPDDSKHSADDSEYHNHRIFGHAGI